MLGVSRKDEAKEINVTLENSKPNAMDVYNILWRGRDFELSHLWQRSVFLAVFLLGISSVYGVYFKDVFLEQFKDSHQNVNLSISSSCNANININVKEEANGYREGSKIFVFGVVPIAITVIGIIFSILWIMMAKGSKAWQEIYEDSIAKVSVIKEFWSNKSFREVYGEAKDNEFLFGNLLLKDGTKCDKCLFSTAGGAFSVSKINVMIGIVFLVLFVGLFLVHTIWTLYLSISFCSKLILSTKSWDAGLILCVNNNLPIYSYVYLCVDCCRFIIALVVMICCFIKEKCLSSYDFKNNQMSA